MQCKLKTDHPPNKLSYVGVGSERLCWCSVSMSDVWTGTKKERISFLWWKRLIMNVESATKLRLCNDHTNDVQLERNKYYIINKYNQICTPGVNGARQWVRTMKQGCCFLLTWSPQWHNEQGQINTSLCPGQQYTRAPSSRPQDFYNLVTYRINVSNIHEI